MKKILYIAPHLSTGGLPQYLTKKIELLRDSFEIHVVEWSDHTGGVLVVQRDRITSMVDEDKFYTLNNDKSVLLDIIDRIKPDIVHLEEIPEYFMDFDVAKSIYKVDRSYSIIETSHDSSYDATQKKFFPDKFMFVSDWQIKLFDVIDDIPKVLVEYPIEYKDRPERNVSLLNLGLDPRKKHVLHVGLFTPRKNQAEFFDYARSLPEYVFHSVGNQSGNFAHYWEPLMLDKPDNVIWHGERNDVDNFYSSMDLFLFTSRGTNNDKETMPLVIREAISWKIPTLIYNLGVYLNYFDKYDTVEYLDYTNFDDNCVKIKDMLNASDENKPKEVKASSEAIIISTYPTTKSALDTTVECILGAKNTGRQVILTSHLPIPTELQSMVDYVVYDKNNILTKHTFYNQSRFTGENFSSFVNLNGENNDVYHGPTCYSNYYNGASLANSLGIEKVYFLNYDYIIKDKSYIDSISRVLDDKKGYFGDMPNNQEGHSVTTFFMGVNTDFYLETVEPIFEAKDYEDLRVKWGSYSNGYENMMYFAFKSKMDQIELVDEESFNNEISQYMEHKDYSMVEYFTVLKSNIPNTFVTYLQVSNMFDSRVINIKVTKNGDIISEENITVDGKIAWYNTYSYDIRSNDVYSVIYTSFDKESGKQIENKSIVVNNDYINNTISDNGLFTHRLNKGDINIIGLDESGPKIRIVHLVTEPDVNPKEIISTKSLKEFSDKFDNIEYHQKINEIYRDLPPSETCHRPKDISIEPGYFKLSPGHYGCFLAHKNGISIKSNEDFDIILVFEGDVIIDSPHEELYSKLLDWSRLAKEEDMDMVGFGNYCAESYDGKRDDLLLNLTIFAPAQSYLINKEKLPIFVNKFEECKWEAFDLWMTKVAGLKGAMSEKIYTKHLPGYSIVDKKEKNKDNDYSQIFAG